MSRKNGGIIGPANTPVGGLFKGVAGGVWRMNDVANFVGNSQWPSTPQSIDNSCRFDRASGDYLSRTPSGAGNRKIFTFSTWLKGHDAAVQGSSYFFHADISGSSNVDVFGVTASGVQVSINSANSGDLNSSALFRDMSAWYHMVFAVDTTQGTASNRLKIYVNGTQITAFDTETYPSQDYQFTGFNTTQEHNVSWADSEHNGYLAETIFVDGQQLEPTSFGATNPVTNIWEPIPYAGTYGTNGFRLDYGDSSALGADVSGNSNNFSVNNLTSIDQSTDTCSNNFCTLNPLYRVPAFSYSEGNLKATASSSGKGTARGTMGIQDSGKWYFEVKITTDDACGVGISNEDMDANTWQPTSGTFVIYHNNGTKVVNGTASSYGATYGDGDIIGVAYNADDAEITFYKNGASQSTITGVTTGKFMLPSISDTGTSSDAILECNFGSPSFSISSGNADANGHGNFEYSVPSGYFALCTKNLAEFG